MKGHSGSVLALVLSEQEGLLFSSSGDAIVNVCAGLILLNCWFFIVNVKVKVWDAVGYKLLYSIYSTFDVGDVFCIAYSRALQTAYFGAQNTSIQVC